MNFLSGQAASLVLLLAAVVELETLPATDSWKSLGLSKRQLVDSRFTTLYANYLRTQAGLKELADLLRQILKAKRSNDDNLEERFNPSRSRMEDESVDSKYQKTCKDWLQSYLLNAGYDVKGLYRLFDQHLCPIFSILIADLKLGPLPLANKPMER